MKRVVVKIAVVALGKIGLPLAVQCALKGHEVYGIDVNPKQVDLINKGIEPFPGEKDLAKHLKDVVASGNLKATTDYTAAIPNVDAIMLVVPLFIDDEARPDFGWMDEATTELAKHLNPGTLISYETTLPVGTTRNRWKPMIEKESRLTEGKDFHLVFSPERVLTGRVFEDLARYPKLIGGLNEIGNKKAKEFYEAILDFDERDDLPQANGVWDLGTAEAAEMAKLAETTYRDVNIGLANQYARFADKNDIDIYKVIEACNSQPYSHIHQPGISVGGHCIPVYPRLYLWNDNDATVVRNARAANADMPNYTVGLLEGLHSDLKGQKVTVLGASYRPGVKETAFSGVFNTVKTLEKQGAEVTVHDEMFDADELKQLGFTPYEIGDKTDAAIIHTNHATYKDLTAKDMPGIKTIVDGRNIIDPKNWSDVTYKVIGKPQD